MAITINGTGSITGISAGGLPDASVTQPELASGVAGTGPAFSAYPAAGTSISNVTFTKIALLTESFDTNNNYDTSLSRFTPTVAGYYQFNGRISFGANLTSVFCALFKNGSETNRGCGGVLNSPTVSAIIYMNGSTDYVELYAYQNTGSSQTNGNGASENYFQASMVRAA